MVVSLWMFGIAMAITNKHLIIHLFLYTNSSSSVMNRVIGTVKQSAALLTDLEMHQK